jgi:penicillin V acylase-like amidase (Ntn superfamily)
VVEFVDSAMRVHTDLNDDGETGYGIMTNEPEFEYQLTNIKHLQWKRGLARQSVSVPGSWYPEERFMRIYMVKSGMEAPTSYSQAIMQAVHVLNTITVPMGNQFGTDSGAKSGEGSGDHTLYGVVYDHLGKKLYWRTTNNQNLQKLDLLEALSKQTKLVLPAVQNE